MVRDHNIIITDIIARPSASSRFWDTSQVVVLPHSPHFFLLAGWTVKDNFEIRNTISRPAVAVSYVCFTVYSIYDKSYIVKQADFSSLPLVLDLIILSANHICTCSWHEAGANSKS